MWPNEALPSWCRIQTTRDRSLGAWQAAKGAEAEAEALDPEDPLLAPSPTGHGATGPQA